MKFSIATLLSQLNDNKLVAPKLIEKKLECETETDVEKLQIALDALERIGLVGKERGKYRLLSQEDMVEARLRCSSKGFCFAIQDVEGTEDIYIKESHLGSAWNGDRVLVRVIKEASRRRSPEGEVKVILERSNPTLLAQVKRRGDRYRAVPLDDRLLFEIDLHQSEEFLENAIEHLVHVEVLRYPLGSQPPYGHVTRVLGSDAEEASDIEIVCCKHNLKRTFSEAALEQARSLPTELDPGATANRLDYRDVLTLTLEDVALDNTPAGAIVENAFSLEKTASGSWKLGIHITDIATYVPYDSPLDRDLRRRGTAIDLGELQLPMFPEEVARCVSLEPGVDRLAVSIFVVLDALGQIESYEIRPSVVRVDRHFTYQQVQPLLGQVGTAEPELATAFEMLNELFFTLSPRVKAQRLQRGGFELELAGVSPYFKDEGRLGTIAITPGLPVRSMLSEVMVLAGRVVASHLKALDVPSLYCLQSPPDPSELEDIIKLGNNLGLELALESEEEVFPQDYQNFTQQFAQSSAPRVMSYLLKETLKTVKYGLKPGYYFGLAESDGYSPCVSPGKRYADLTIQRVWNAIFEKGRDRRHSRSKEGIDLGSSDSKSKINWNVLPTAIGSELEAQIAEFIYRLNDLEKLAQDAEGDLEGLKKAEKMKEQTGEVFRGLITGVQSYGFFVEIEDRLVEGLVHVSSLKDDWYEYRARHACLVGRKNRIAYRLGDRVEVKVKSVDYYRQQIDLVTVNGGSSTATDEDFEDK